MTEPPVQAIALFFDDIRMEAGNKLSFMGQLLGTAYLTTLDPSQQLDRIAIVVHAKWPLSFRPETIMLRVAIAGQTAFEQESAPPETPETEAPPNEFSGQALQAAVMLRGQPINPGDEVKVWLRVDGHDIPAGQLRFEKQPAG